MKKIYDWVPWFTELARKIAEGGPEYLADRAKKVQWRSGEKLQPLLAYGDENIDPFSFLYTLASKSRAFQTRQIVYPSISKAFDLPELADDDSELTFIFPTPDPRFLLFHYKGEGNPELLWQLFGEAVKGLASIAGNNFDAALEIKGIATTKLTQCLFLINPHQFLPWDINSTQPLGVSDKKKELRWNDYIEVLAAFRKAFPGCKPYEINLFAWLQQTNQLGTGSRKCFQVSPHVGSGARDHWKGDFEPNNWVYATPEGDQSIADALNEPAPGDLVLVRETRTTTQGRGRFTSARAIGVVHKNDYRDAGESDSRARLHVLWVNKRSAKLTWSLSDRPFCSGRKWTIDALREVRDYQPTIRLLEDLGGIEGLAWNDVLRAMSEFDELGRDEFVDRHSYTKSRSYFIENNGNRYDMKPIWRRAYGYADGDSPPRRVDVSAYSKPVEEFLENLRLQYKHDEPGGPVRERKPETVKNRLSKVKHEKNRILYGPPGTGKTWSTVLHSLAIIDGVKLEEAKDDRERFRRYQFDIESGRGQIAMVTFHQNFAYEDFVEGIRPKLDREDLSYELHDGIFKRIARAAARTESSDKAFVLIIDEINRGNIAKIFGELITLIEDSRRVGEEDETEVTLPYSVEPFSIPGNLYIIGTMNTADRSIQLLDTALRRRFTFFEMMPNPEHDLVPQNVEGVDCRRMLKAINERITVLLDREHQIGHTYFKEVDDIEQLANAFRNQIFPLLQEYFFDDWGKIHRVLNGNGFVSTRNAASLLPADEQSDEETTIYERLRHNDAKWSDPEEYKAIYVSPDVSEA